MQPKSIAFIGGEPAAEVLKQCMEIGYEGEMWPIHPRHNEVEGLPCYRTVGDLPGVPDATFLGTSPQVSIELLKELNALGAGGALCYASGFAESGAAGAVLQEQLLAAGADMALIGPNCHGMINYLDRVALWPDEHGGEPVDSGVAFILQSGNVGISISMQARNLPISHLITIGNQADLGIHDYVDILLDDERVRVICLYIEGLNDIAEFSRVALRALNKKVAIVALKSGTSELGAIATLSHTSSLAGPDEMYNELFKRFGIARADTLHELLETAKFLAVNGALAGDAITSMSCSGGEASMIADQAERLGLRMPPFSTEANKKLHSVLGDKVHISNPLDYHTYIWDDYDAMRDCFLAVLNEDYDCTIFVIDYPREGINNDSWALAVSALVDAREIADKCAVVMSTMAENIPSRERASMMERGIAPMQGLRECLVAIKCAADIGQAQARAASIIPLQEASLHEGGPVTIDEFESKQLLADFGLPIPRGKQGSVHEIVAIADELTYPVCLKILSSEISHKSDVGGVRLNLHDKDEVAEAAATMATLGERYLVEAMADKPVAELIVGVKRDPQFGLVIVIGAGGIFVELLRDTATLLLPVTRVDIELALDSLKISTIINGFRGSVAGDRDALVAAIESVARFAEAHHDTLIELDINPLFVLPEGRGVCAVDALVRLAQ